MDKFESGDTATNSKNFRGGVITLTEMLVLPYRSAKVIGFWLQVVNGLWAKGAQEEGKKDLWPYDMGLELVW